MATMTKEERTRIEAMAFFGLSKLPKKLRKEETYTSAIVKIQKFDGNMYYAIQRSDKTGNLRIVKDFEELYAISSIEEVYPIDPFMPIIEGKSLKIMDIVEKIVFLTNCKQEWIPSAEELGKMEVEHLDELCVRVLRAMKMV
jgi:hypothetical protein